MFAQVIEGTSAAGCNETNDLIKSELIPALQEEPGFAGALSLFDDMGRTMMIFVWDNEEQALLPSTERNSTLTQALSDIASLCPRTNEPATIWKVAAKVVHTGSTRRLTGEPSL